jgi:TonB family protein
MTAKRKYGIIGLLISLIIHCFIAVSIIIKQSHKDLSQQKNEWVETKSYHRQNGASIFIVNNSSQTADNIYEQYSGTKQSATTHTKKNCILASSPTLQANHLKAPSSQQNASLSSFTAHKRCNNAVNPPHRSIPKQFPSLSQLTQGIMNYVKEEGQYKVSMIGKKSGVPSDEQLKYERYLERLNGCLHNACAIMRDKAPHMHTQYKTHILLALNADGSLHNLRLERSSGNNAVDMFILSVFRYASSSFPPVPHYLPHNPFTITYIFDICH